MNTLVIVGAGGHGKVCSDIADRTGCFSDIVFSDNGVAKGTRVVRWSVEYHDEDLPALDAERHVFILGVGQIGLGGGRQTLFERIIGAGLLPTTIVSPDAMVSTSVAIGPGTFVGPMGILNVDARVGRNVIVNSRALVEHDATVGNHSHISTAGIVNGEAVVGQRCLVGSGAVVLQGVHVCDDVVIGAGAVVTHTIEEPGTYAGVPARKIHD